ncbi:thyroid transcription factor 1-associated protein 26 homolog [Notolabrus celidotus]|uniref:thyroid transcription factor 1-associated protein 26 homolog n=1 Tax=Notolabrus celidotus TaxID=1203425 RepID=UPI00148FBBC0|nr:thyroid transcription factor 1-associated protein 26 homolog [Notolabrus celidotus]
MASTDRKMEKNKAVRRDGNWRKSKNETQGVKKRKWVSEHKLYEGSVKEGQGFAFKRKEKVKHEYNKLLRKERKRNPGSKSMYEEQYPENLRHLYLAEAEKLKSEAWTHRLNRSKLRMKVQEERKEERGKDEDAAARQSEPVDADPDVTGGSEQTHSITGDHKVPGAPEEESLPISNRMKKKMLKKTSYQKTKEDFEAIKEKRRHKKEEYLKNKQQREEATKMYKQKKMETYQMLSKRTKKGQPNLNLQMEHLLQKIQGSGK